MIWCGGGEADSGYLETWLTNPGLLKDLSKKELFKLVPKGWPAIVWHSQKEKTRLNEGEFIDRKC